MKYFAVLLGLMATLVTHAAAQGLLPDTWPSLAQRQPCEARRQSSSNPDLTSNGDSRPIPPGETLTLLDADGPGVITHFWNTIAALDPFAGRSVVLRIYYDGRDKPSVQVPLGDFFGVGHGAMKEFSSAVVSVSAHGLSRSCYWPIPFRQHIKVTVTNESPKYPVADFYYYLDWQKRERLPEDTEYFHAQYRQAMPAPPGHYTILETQGQGHYVGTVYSVEQVELGWFGEGDDFFYIDGAETPQLRGTGTEDYFNDAWGFHEFATPFHGVSLYEGVFPSDRVSAYRWHLADPIPFQKSLRLVIEHRGSVVDETTRGDIASLARSSERPDWVSSVAFWYQNPVTTLDAPLPPADQRQAPYRVLPVKTLVCRAEPAEQVKPSHAGVSYWSETPTAAIEFDLVLEQPGRYRLRGLFEDSLAGAVWQASLDGQPLGAPLDMVVPEGAYVWRDLDLHDLTAGKHTLRFEKLSQRSPASRSIRFQGTQFTLEYLVLLRLEDMAGYHQLYQKLRAAKK